MNQNKTGTFSPTDSLIRPIIEQALAELYETNIDVAVLPRNQVRTVLTNVANQVRGLAQSTEPESSSGEEKEIDWVSVEAISQGKAEVWTYEPDGTKMVFIPGAWRREA